MTKIILFHELRKPARMADGRWYAGVKGSIIKFFNVRGEIVNLTFGQTDSEIYFDSEIEVHEAAAAYYTRYGKRYPYFGDWVTSARDLTTTQPVESQPMNFS